MDNSASSFLRVTLLQMVSAGADIEANAAKGEAFCRSAANQGANIAVFPEMWSIGYTKYPLGNERARGDWLKLAVPRDGSFVQRFRCLARELRMAIAITYLEAHTELPRDSVTLIGPDGADVFTYAKVHTCAWDSPEESLTAGQEFRVGNVPTRGDNAKVGAMICFDREFPESARLLMLKGAEVILTPSAGDLIDKETGDIRIAQFRARAFENAVGTAMVNYAAPQSDGCSVAFDVNGATLVEARSEEGVFIAEFDLKRIREWRRIERSNIWRRPEIYGALSDEATIDPLAQSRIDTISEEKRRPDRDRPMTGSRKRTARAY
ncbi:MAG: carbon-nitrogen hydrolase family protein [Deltaproteobacteria bacterium]|nr:carbon-nitrogen hydrolase family protein [Deltaproteobacteria bacterium]